MDGDKARKDFPKGKTPSTREKPDQGKPTSQGHQSLYRRKRHPMSCADNEKQRGLFRLPRQQSESQMLPTAVAQPSTSIFYPQLPPTPEESASSEQADLFGAQLQNVQRSKIASLMQIDPIPDPSGRPVVQQSMDASLMQAQPVPGQSGKVSLAEKKGKIFSPMQIDPPE